MPSSLPIRKTSRLKEYDYRSVGCYFVTICTKDRIRHFGSIQNKEMRLNDFGKIVQRCWFDIPNHFSHVELDEFVIMPNHVHGIVMMNDLSNSDCRDGIHAIRPLSNRIVVGPDNPMKSNGLGKIIRWFKGRTTFEIHKIISMGKIDGITDRETSDDTSDSMNAVPTRQSKPTNQSIWQSRFHDRVIRDPGALDRIQTYIRMNPECWDTDEFFKFA